MGSLHHTFGCSSLDSTSTCDIIVKLNAQRTQWLQLPDRFERSYSQLLPLVTRKTHAIPTTDICTHGNTTARFSALSPHLHSPKKHAAAHITPPFLFIVTSPFFDIHHRTNHLLSCPCSTNASSSSSFDRLFANSTTLHYAPLRSATACHKAESLTLHHHHANDAFSGNLSSCRDSTCIGLRTRKLVSVA